MPLALTDRPWAIDRDPETLQPEYAAAEIRRALSGLLANGGARAGSLTPNALRITLSGTTVRAAAGVYVVPSTAGAYLFPLASLGNVDTLAVADATNPRVDHVVARVLDPTAGSGSGERGGVIEVITGTPSASPALPNPAGTFSTLARIDVPRSGGGSPTVTDTRSQTVATGGTLVVKNASDLATITAANGMVVFREDTGLLYVRRASWWWPLQETQSVTTTNVSLTGMQTGAWAQLISEGNHRTCRIYGKRNSSGGSITIGQIASSNVGGRNIEFVGSPQGAATWIESTGAIRMGSSSAGDEYKATITWIVT